MEITLLLALILIVGFMAAKAGNNLPFVKCFVAKSEARMETIIKEAQAHDLPVMAVSEGAGFKKMLLGSLADDVASNCQRPMLMVHRKS